MPDTPTTPEAPGAHPCRLHQRNIHPASMIMFCGRCGHATGGGYGHYYAWCLAAGKMRAAYHCCPGSCALDDGEPMNPIAPCHPGPNMIAEWAYRVDEHGAAIESRPTPLADVAHDDDVLLDDAPIGTVEQPQVEPVDDRCPRGCPPMECYCSDGSEPRWCGHGPGGECPRCRGCYACDACHCGEG